RPGEDMTQPSRFEVGYRKSLARMINERHYMVFATDSLPDDPGFPSSLETIAAALENGPERDDLLIVLQPLRLRLEQHAGRRGLSEHDLAETAQVDEVDEVDEGDQPRKYPRRRGHFEHDVLQRYVPQYLDVAQDGQTKVSLRTHVRRGFRSGLRQRVRRGK